MKNKLVVLGQDVKVVKKGTEDFMCLTEIYNSYGIETGKSIESFIRSSEILEFLTEWEITHNPNFKSISGYAIKEDAKNKVNLMSVLKWVNQTDAIGIYAVKGKYGGTYAHATIALRFCAYLSKKLEVTVYEDYLTYKKLEYANQRTELRQDIATDYGSMCVMVDEVLKPTLSTYDQQYVFAKEADMINRIAFGYTASEWKKAFPHLVVKNYNQRDYCTDAQRECVKRLQLKNSLLLEMGILDEQVRIKSLIKQRDISMPHLNKTKSTETLRPLSDLD